MKSGTEIVGLKQRQRFALAFSWTIAKARDQACASQLGIGSLSLDRTGGNQ